MLHRQRQGPALRPGHDRGCDPRLRFFERNRKQLAERGIDPARLPPGQYSTDRFPVLHEGPVPDYGDLSAWDLQVSGVVGEARRFSWDQLMELPAVDVVTDIHCVTKWSKFDTTWRGIALDAVLDVVGRHPSATHLMCHCEYGYTANVPLVDVTGDRIGLLAFAYDGKPLEREHGYPLRFFVPHLYFWKSAKWLRGIELMAGDRPGFWEQNGYHIYGDPFREQRFTND